MTCVTTILGACWATPPTVSLPTNVVRLFFTWFKARNHSLKQVVGCLFSKIIAQIYVFTFLIKTTVYHFTVFDHTQVLLHQFLLTFAFAVKRLWRTFQHDHTAIVDAFDCLVMSIFYAPCWNTNCINFVSPMHFCFTHFFFIILCGLEKTQNNLPGVHMVFFQLVIKWNYTLFKVVKLITFWGSNLFLHKKTLMGIN